jgi:serine/threonine protein phosphatase PrpC
MTWLQHIRQRLAESPQSPQQLMVDAAVRTDIGRVRDGNEDSVLFVRPWQPTLKASRGVLAVAADGMGGANTGEVASGLACQTISEIYFATPGSPGEALNAAFQTANQRIFAYATERPECHGMGTTAVAVAVVGNIAWLANIGDSRIYLLRDSRIYQMSQDDSLVAQMVRDGLITDEQARSHEDRNVLIRALGTKPEVQLACVPEAFECRAGDSFLLCTDGLHDLVSEQEMLQAASSCRAAVAAERLIEMANARGGGDNVSVVLVAVNLPPAVCGQAAETREVLVKQP